MEAKQSLNFLLTEGEVGWYARCLEHDFVIQADTLVGLLHEIERAIVGRFVIGTAQGIDPFIGLSRASERHWEIFRRSTAVVRIRDVMLSIGRQDTTDLPELQELRIAPEEVPA